MTRRREREIRTWKNAEDEHFLKFLDENELISHAALTLQNGGVESKEDVLIVSRRKEQLHRIDVLRQFENLQVCVLSCNFISDITSLRYCRLLVKIDVHGNQISRIPGEAFWCNFQRLIVLCLHNNTIHDVEDVKHLAAARNLTILTMQDTPASLKRFYRHLAVNAIWSLKSLDDHVVSDEEIIEEANFKNRFSSLQPCLSVKHRLLSIKENTCSLECELQQISHDLQVINGIQAKSCPVIFLQRHIRGYLQRQRYKSMLDNRLWAAVSIQRFYRRCKGLPNPPPSSPVTKPTPGADSSVSSLKFDYDNYVNRQMSLLNGSSSNLPSSSLDGASWRQLEQSRSRLLNRKVRLDVHLPKMKSSAGKQMNSATHQDLQPKLRLLPRRANSLSEPVEREHYNVAKTSKLQQTTETSIRNDANHTIDGRCITTGDNNCHVEGLKQSLISSNRLKDHYTEIVTAAEMIRESIQQQHSIISTCREGSKLTAQRHMHQRPPKAVSNANLSCFRSIDKAYTDQRKILQQMKREQHVKESRIMSDLKRSEMRSKLLKQQHQRHENRLTATKESRENSRKDDNRNEVNPKRTTEEQKKARNSSKEFVKHFRCQVNKISKVALQEYIGNLREARALQLADKIKRERCKEKFKERSYTTSYKLLGASRMNSILNTGWQFGHRRGSRSHEHRIVSDTCHRYDQPLTGTAESIPCQRVDVAGMFNV